ncbi:MAG: DUF503 domain-containing protein [Chloroflexota bacterium]
MNVGVLSIKLRLPENLSLKGKRQIIRPIISRVGSKFNVAVAEVDHQDLWQLATLGIASVSDDSRFTNEVLSKVVAFITESHFDVEILDYRIEIIPLNEL